MVEAYETATVPRRGVDGPWPSIVLCVPTFRRAQGLRKLLTDVANLQYAESAMSIVVVDNDAEQQIGASIVAEMAPTFPFPLKVFVEARRGQTYAYNRAFNAACGARSDYVAVLDDDEYPDRHWLAEMVATAVRFDADIVGGPVLPVFEQPDNWLARAGFHQPRRFATGPVDMIYGAGSMLIRRSVLEAYLDEPFSHDFAFTGGSDLEFFTRCRRDGRTFAWADAAIVFETTPSKRTTIGWLVRRNFRKGTEATRIDRKFNRSLQSRLWRWARGFSVFGVGVAALPFAAIAGRRIFVKSLSMAARGAGRIAAEFDLLYEEYR